MSSFFSFFSYHITIIRVVVLLWLPVSVLLHACLGPHRWRLWRMCSFPPLLWALHSTPVEGLADSLASLVPLDTAKAVAMAPATSDGATSAKPTVADAAQHPQPDHDDGLLEEGEVVPQAAPVTEGATAAGGGTLSSDATLPSSRTEIGSTNWSAASTAGWSTSTQSRQGGSSSEEDTRDKATLALRALALQTLKRRRAAKTSRPAALHSSSSPADDGRSPSPPRRKRARVSPGETTSDSAADSATATATATATAAATETPASRDGFMTPREFTSPADEDLMKKLREAALSSMRLRIQARQPQTVTADTEADALAEPTTACVPDASSNLPSSHAPPQQARDPAPPTSSSQTSSGGAVLKPSGDLDSHPTPRAGTGDNTAVATPNTTITPNSRRIISALTPVHQRLTALSQRLVVTIRAIDMPLNTDVDVETWHTRGSLPINACTAAPPVAAKKEGVAVSLSANSKAARLRITPKQPPKLKNPAQPQPPQTAKEEQLETPPKQQQLAQQQQSECLPASNSVRPTKPEKQAASAPTAASKPNAEPAPPQHPRPDQQPRMEKTGVDPWELLMLPATVDAGTDHGPPQAFGGRRDFVYRMPAEVSSSTQTPCDNDAEKRRLFAQMVELEQLVASEMVRAVWWFVVLFRAMPHIPVCGTSQRTASLRESLLIESRAQLKRAQVG